MSKQKFIETRDEYVECIKKQLLGPGSEGSCPDFEHEILSTVAAGKYCLGIIYPQDESYDGKNDSDSSSQALNGKNAAGQDVTDSSSGSTGYDDGVYFFDDFGMDEMQNADTNAPEDVSATADEDDDSADTVNLAMQRKPSSFGLTFYTNENPEKMSVDVEFAVYEKNKMDDCAVFLDEEVPSEVNLAESPVAVVSVENAGECTDAAGKTNLRKILKFKKGIKEDALYDEIKKFDDNQMKGKESLYNFRNKVYLLKEQYRVGEHRIPYSENVNFVFKQEKRKEFLEIKSQNNPFVSVKILKHIFNVDGKSIKSFTVMMVNNSVSEKTGSITLLQPKIIVKTDDKINVFTFADYSQTVSNAFLDEEEQNLNLLYRNKKTYATGLGTAAYWEIDENGKGFIQSDFYPSKELPEMAFERDDEFAISKEILSMKYLSDLEENGSGEDSDAEIAKIESLKEVPEKYEAWIHKIALEADSLGEVYKAPAKKNIEFCSQALSRIKEGIEILLRQDETGRKIRAAFFLANRAMYMQREQLSIQKNDDNRAFYWRPFQLAFLLLSIKSIVEGNVDNHQADSAVTASTEFNRNIESDRNIVDLIWFPTGGGKTEAYLGLTAMTIFYRRLAYPLKSGGTTVIMRYTMRLLTTQQYLRAATLICACEKIRIEEQKKNGYPLGKDEITIGLWVGSQHTPNDFAEANQKIKNLQNPRTESDIDSNFKFQVRKCPWCGRSLIPVPVVDKKSGRINFTNGCGYQSTKGKSMSVNCLNEDCYFNEDNFGPLPIKMVDEDLYENPPTLLFGTVDKFAMLAWKNESGKFFGIGTKNRAPELIIQDELHLISSSLGTIVGLYETAIDKLCSLKKSRPKIIASTATIRRAVEQCRALYDRPVSQFPAPGIDSSDSYFSREGNINHQKDKFGRLYVGMMSPKVKDMVETKSIANMLQASKILKMPDENGDEDVELKDAFWTLVVYFNTTRELGKCRSLINANVISTINSLSYLSGSQKRYIGQVYELTGQTKTSELVKALDTIEKVTYQDSKNKENSQMPASIVLATNMISVGIDIPRLNVMLIVGQPKLTSEYIQASSRIGRNNPGVSFVIYDSARSRDRSHFEQFKPYHESFYKFVEPTGVTPFSEPARKRALHALIIIMLRNMLPDLLGKEKQAENLLDKNGNVPPVVQAAIQEIKSFIITREESISKMSGLESDKEKISAEIDDFIEKWQELIIRNRNASGSDDENSAPFSYGYSFIARPTELPDNVLLKTAGSDSSKPAQETLTSMRNVDKTVSADVLIDDSII